MKTNRRCEGLSRHGNRCRHEAAYASGPALCAFHLGLGHADRRFLRNVEKLRKQVARHPETRLWAETFVEALGREG
jgi:hypothetical protein